MSAPVGVFRIRRAKPGPLHLEAYKDDRITRALCSLVVLVGDVQRAQVDPDTLPRYRVCLRCVRQRAAQVAAASPIEPGPEVHEVRSQ